MTWVWTYLLVGVAQVFFNFGRGIGIEFLQPHDWTELKRGGGRVEHVQEREWVEFFVFILIELLFWLPMWILGAVLHFLAWRRARWFHRTNQRQEMGL